MAATYLEIKALTPETGMIAASTPVIVLVDEWGRDTCVINEVCAIIELPKY